MIYRDLRRQFNPVFQMLQNITRIIYNIFWILT